MDFLHCITFEMIVACSMIILQLVMEFKRDDNRVAREMVVHNRMLFFGATMVFLTEMPFYSEQVVYCIVAYANVLATCFFLEWKFPTDPNSAIVKRFQELLKKKREERGMKLPESPLFLKLCEIGNKVLPYLVVAVSIGVIIKIGVIFSKGLVC